MTKVKASCWIDGKACYSIAKDPTLEMCRLCRRTRLAKLALRKEQPITFEI